MYTMHVNVQMTRRQQFVFVCDEHDEVRWSGTSYCQALDHILDAGETRFKVEGPEPEDRYVVTARRP